MAELIELSSCTFGLVPESKLSHKPQVQYGFVPKLSRHCGKNIVSLRFTKKSCALLNMFFSAKREVFRFLSAFFCVILLPESNLSLLLWRESQ